MSTNKNAPTTAEVSKGAKKNRPQNYTTSAPEVHPAHLMLQRKLASMSWKHCYSDSRPGGALINSIMIYLIKSPNYRACRVTTLKSIAKKTGFTPVETRNALHWLTLIGVVRQLATNDSSITLALSDGGEENDY